MPNYLRARVEGGTYFFTMVTDHRLPILTKASSRKVLRNAFVRTQERIPFENVAICLLPDHIHCIWKLPEGDADYSTRWKLIKKFFTWNYLHEVGPGNERTAYKKSRREATIWQRRFWEHTISDEIDLENHLDYIHFNPIKHEYVTRAADWPWSSFHRFVKEGVYDLDWCGGAEGRLKMLNWDRFIFG